MNAADREILKHFRQIRQRTIDLLERLPEEMLTRQADGEGLPLGTTDAAGLVARLLGPSGTPYAAVQSPSGTPSPSKCRVLFVTNVASVFKAETAMSRSRSSIDRPARWISAQSFAAACQSWRVTLTAGQSRERASYLSNCRLAPLSTR